MQSVPQLVQGNLRVLAIFHAALSKGELLDVARVVQKFPSVGAVRIKADAALVERQSNGDSQIVVDVAHGAANVIVSVDGLKGGVRTRETKVAVGGGVEAMVRAFGETTAAQGPGSV